MARLDDYSVVLGMELLKQAKMLVIPHLGGIQVLHERDAGWVPAVE